MKNVDQIINSLLQPLEVVGYMAHYAALRPVAQTAGGYVRALDYGSSQVVPHYYMATNGIAQRQNYFKSLRCPVVTWIEPIFNPNGDERL